MSVKRRSKRKTSTIRASGPPETATASDEAGSEVSPPAVPGAEHAVVQSEVNLEDLKARRVALRNRLLEIFEEFDPVELVAKASIVYLSIDPNTHKEWENDRSPAHVEYIALQALGYIRDGSKQVDHMRALELTLEAIGIVREIFDVTYSILISETLDAYSKNPEDASIEYSYRARIQSTGVRVGGYSEHISKIARDCLGTFDDECRKVLGYTASEALSMIRGIYRVISARIDIQYKGLEGDAASLAQKIKRVRRGKEPYVGEFPEWVLTAPWSRVEIHIGLAHTATVFRDSKLISVITAEDLSGECSIDIDACEKFLDSFSCPPDDFNEDHHSFPGGAHPLTVCPIIRVESGYLVPVISTLPDIIRPRMEDLLARNQRVWTRYLRARGEYLEVEATSLLASVIPGAKYWTGVKWKSSSDSSDIDGLITSDDLVMRIQCKAGRLSAPARRGAAGRMKGDVEKLIQSAAKQHAALDHAIKLEGLNNIGLGRQKIAALNSRIHFEIIVCLDNVTVWATEAHELERLGALAGAENIPWVVSLSDLMAVVDLLDGAQLIQYLLRRLRLEKDGRVSAHDELDWVGHYIAQGLHFDHIFDREQSVDRVSLTTFTEDIDSWYMKRSGHRSVPTSKPQQNVPYYLSKIIRRLETERPKHWMLAAIALLDGDDSSRDLWDHNIANIGSKIRENGWSNASQVFNGRLGVTIFMDRRFGVPDIADQARIYCLKKAEKHDIPVWIGISEGRDGKLLVILIEYRKEVSVMDVFVAPMDRSGEV